MLKAYFIINILAIPMWLYDFEFQAFFWQSYFAVGPYVAFAMIVVALLFLLVTLASLILFIFWTFRVACNVRTLGATDIPTSPTWAVLWYFIPIAFFWKPYTALRDIWAASENPQGWVWFEPPRLFTVYWTLCVIDKITGFAAYRAEDQIANWPLSAIVTLNLAATVVVLAYTGLQIRIIRRITDAQLRNWQQDVFT